MILSLWWAATLLLVSAQAYIMTGSLVVLCAAILVSCALWFAFRRLAKLKSFMLVVIGLHFLPLVLQFMTLTQPGLDNVVAASIGWILFIIFEAKK